MLPILELSSVLVDRAAADMSDSEGETSVQPVDMLTLEKAHEVCAQAIRNGGVVPPSSDKQILQWLQACKIIEVFESGEFCLTRDSVKHGVKLSGDVLDKTLRSERTTLEVQEELLSAGWTFVDQHADATVLGKKILQVNPSTYFHLMMNFAEMLELYEDEDQSLFHHKQSEGYYKTILTALIHAPEELVLVPTYQPAGFYSQLQKFLTQETTVDPREELEEKKPRSHYVMFQTILLF